MTTPPIRVLLAALAVAGLQPSFAFAHTECYDGSDGGMADTQPLKPSRVTLKREVIAQDTKPKKPDAATSASDAASLAEGEVRRVDKDAKRIAIKHGPLQKLEMPPMTMVFQVNDARLLEGLKAGDRVMFQADKMNGRLIVTEIRPAK